MKTTSTTKPVRGEHLISYAYPTSPLATRLKCASCGCYAVQTHDAAAAFPSYRDALTHVEQLKTSPQRWSMDHPLNAKYLDGIHAFEKIEPRPGAVSPVYIVGAEIRSQAGDVVASCSSHSRAFKILSVARDQSAYADWMAGLSPDDLALSRQVNAFLYSAQQATESAHAPL